MYSDDDKLSFPEMIRWGSMTVAFLVALSLLAVWDAQFALEAFLALGC